MTGTGYLILIILIIVAGISYPFVAMIISMLKRAKKRNQQEKLLDQKWIENPNKYKKKTLDSVSRENWQKEAYEGRLEKAPMIEFENVIVYFPKYESEFGVEKVEKLIFLWKNNNSYSMDLKLSFDAYEETLRDKDGVFIKIYRDKPEAISSNLPAGETGRITMYFGGKGINAKKYPTANAENRPMILESIFVKPHTSSETEWKDYQINVKIKNGYITKEPEK